MLYQRAYEIAIWATPLLNTLQMGAEMRRQGVAPIINFASASLRRL
jgi:hypothetical protein